MARPPLTDRDAVRSVKVQIMVTREQRERWTKAAASAGLTLSEWARAALIRAARTG